MKLKLFDSQFSNANNTENLTLLPHFNRHHLEKNAPHHMILQINTSYKAIYFLAFEKLNSSSKTDFKKSSNSFVSQLQLRPFMVLMFKCCSCPFCCTALQMLDSLFARVAPLTHAAALTKLTTGESIARLFVHCVNFWIEFIHRRNRVYLGLTYHVKWSFWNKSHSFSFSTQINKPFSLPLQSRIVSERHSQIG